MTTNKTSSRTARHYLQELQSALSDASPAVRADLLADIGAELDGLDEEQAAARIAALGDPRRIAADAMAEDAASTPPRSRTYPRVTVLVLIFGGYLVPVIGWIVGLVLVGIGAGWERAVRRRAIIVSIIGMIVAFALLMTLHAIRHGAVLTDLGLIAILVVPFVVNVVVGRYLSLRWDRAN